MDELDLRRLYAKGAIDEATFKSQMQYIMQIKAHGLLGSAYDKQLGMERANGAVDTGWQPPKYEPIRPTPVDPMMGQQIGNQSAYDTPIGTPMGESKPYGYDNAIGQQQALSEYDTPIQSPIQQRGAPTPNETDFLNQFVNNAKKAIYR
jgi:hypothetical protein